MGTLRLLFILLTLSTSAFGSAFVSTNGGGLFSTGSSWAGGVAPSTAGDSWTIRSGDTIVYNTDNSAGSGWGASVVSGTLQMTNTLPCKLWMNGNLSGSGSWLVGASNAVIPYGTNQTPTIVINFSGASSSCTMNSTNSIAFYGDTNQCFDTLAANAATTGTTSTNLTLSGTGQTPLVAGDVIYIANNAIQNLGGSVHIVQSVSQVTNVTLVTIPSGNITNNWPGTTFVGPINVNTRSNGTPVIKMSGSIFCEQLTKIATTSIFSSSKTNVWSGVRFMNCGQGPIVCNGSLVSFCSGNNNTSGGIAYSCYVSTFTSCMGNNNTSGGIGNGCYGSTFTSCTGNNNTSGGIGNGCYRSVMVGCSANNALNFGTQAPPMSSIWVNGTNWQSIGGTCSITNLPAPFASNVVVHVAASSNQPCLYYVPLSIRSSQRQATVWVFQTNAVAYTVYTTQHGAENMTTVGTVTNQSGGWTNIPITIYNTSYPNSLWDVYVSAQTTGSANGLSWVSVNTEYSVSRMP